MSGQGAGRAATGAGRRVVVVPGPPALLPEHAGLTDPLPELRAAVEAAVAWLVAEAPRRVLVLSPPASRADRAHGVPEPAGERVARVLLGQAGYGGRVLTDEAAGEADAVLAVADGSARRGEKAPGHLDERSFAFDSAIEEALMLADSAALESLDVRLGAELLAAGVPVLQRLGALDLPVEQVDLDWSGDPYGVQYWVVRWQCAS